MEKDTTEIVDLQYLIKNKITKLNEIGNLYKDTVYENSLNILVSSNDFHSLIIKKLIFITGSYHGCSINGINVIYKNSVTKKLYETSNKVGNHHLLNDQIVFEVDDGDYINSFKVIYGIYDVVRGVNITTNKNKNLSTYNFREYDFFDVIETELIKNKDEKNILVGLIYGVGGHVHNIGGYSIDEKTYKNILVDGFMIYKMIEKKYSNKNSYDEILEDVKTNNLSKNVSLKIDEGMIIKKLF